MQGNADFAHRLDQRNDEEAQFNDEQGRDQQRRRQGGVKPVVFCWQRAEGACNLPPSPAGSNLQTLPMRLGVIADIHGNLPALEAVLARLADLAPDLLVNLGDCASGPLWPLETTRLLRESACQHVRGNHDRALGASEPDGLGRSDSFAWHALAPEDRAWLAGLPFSQTLAGALCIHASPASDEAYLIDTVASGALVAAGHEQVAASLKGTAARLVLCGHSHQPRLVRLENGTVIVNPGSVGCPAYDDPDPPAHVSESGAPHARFAVVTIEGETIAVEHHAIAYDWDRAARRAQANDRPDWAHALLTGTALNRPA